MSRNDTRNARAVQSGEKLSGYMAAKITSAVQSINEQLSHLDGYPGGGEQSGKVRTSSSDTTTERVAARRVRLLEARENIRDGLTDVCRTIDLFDKLLNEAMSRVDPTVEPLPHVVCRDNQHGMDGAIEWGDPLCHTLPVKAGLCERCYKRRHRWRNANGIDSSKDFAA